MTSFSVSTTSSATVGSERKAVWGALTDPGLITRMTPYVRSIDAHGDRWTWHLVKIPLLGSMVSPSFTEVMSFDEPSRIDFAHDPARTDEKAGVEGSYVLSDTSSGTHLAIDLTISVDLPFPRLARPAVHAAMHAVVATMGHRFSANLVHHLEDRR